jgi:hypothetical protein
MITIDKYATFKGFNGLMSMDYLTESDLSILRDDLLWARKQSRLSLKGAVALALAEADQKYAPQYVGRLLRKVRTLPDSLGLTSLNHNVLEALAEICEGLGYGSLANNLDSLIESKKKNK